VFVGLVGVAAATVTIDESRASGRGQSPAELTAGSTATRHFEYVLSNGTLSVYSIDRNDRLVQTVDLPGLGKAPSHGIVVSPRTQRLYVSYGNQSAAGGSLLACEMVVLGRAASGERFTGGLLLDAWSVRRAGKLAWTDTLRVEGETPTGAGFGPANALATVIGVWDAPQPFFEKARALLEAADQVRAGVTLVNGVMVARLLGEATAVRAATMGFLRDFRGCRLPRVWHV